jgi:Flp pilus assembly pilin Flp
MKTVMQFLRNKRGVTPAEYVMIAYFFYIFIMIDVKGLEPSLNTNFLAPPANAVVELRPGDRQ